MQVAIIDDKKLFLRRFVRDVEEHVEKVYTFIHPIEFFTFAKENEEFISSLDYLFVDRLIHEFDADNHRFATEFRRVFPRMKLKLVLYSCSPENRNPDPNFDLRINKDQVDIIEIIENFQTKVHR